jgi:hypothetical protein
MKRAEVGVALTDRATPTSFVTAGGRAATDLQQRRSALPVFAERRAGTVCLVGSGPRCLPRVNV